MFSSTILFQPAVTVIFNHFHVSLHHFAPASTSSITSASIKLMNLPSELAYDSSSSFTNGCSFISLATWSSTEAHAGPLTKHHPGQFPLPGFYVNDFFNFPSPTNSRRTSDPLDHLLTHRDLILINWP